jgi:trimeric autotransporter adhesin
LFVALVRTERKQVLRNLRATARPIHDAAIQLFCKFCVVQPKLALLLTEQENFPAKEIVEIVDVEVAQIVTESELLVTIYRNSFVAVMKTIPRYTPGLMISTNRLLGLSSLCVSLVLLGCGGGGSPAPNGGGNNTPPTPSVTSISPVSIQAGSDATQLTVNGTNFESTTKVQVGGVAEVTTFVSSTKLLVIVPAAQVASGGQLSVVVLNGSVSSGTSTPANFEVDNPAPSIASFSPTAVAAGVPSPVISVVGTGFVPATVIQVNGNSRTTNYVSGTQLNVTLSADDVAAIGSLNLTAFNPSPGGGTSTPASLQVWYPAPGSAITVSPSSIATGGTTPVTVTVTGSGLIPASAIQVNGVARASTYVSSTQMTFQVSVSDQATSQLLYVKVVNPSPGGGASDPASVSILDKTLTPVLTQVTPTQILTGSTDTFIVVAGANLGQQVSDGGWVLTAQIMWNGTALPTQWYSIYGNSQYVSATVPASLLTSAGTANITAFSGTSTPTTSNALTLSVIPPPAPTVSAISPSAGPINTAATLTISGTDFNSSSTVALNGVEVPSTYVSQAQLTVNLPASAVRLPGNLQFTVNTPPPGGGTSGVLSYTAYVPIANNSMVLNPVNGLFYVTVPSSAGAPYGNGVVSVDPETGTLGTPIPVGSEPNRIAVTDDGKYLWVGLDGGSAVRRVNLTSGTADLQFSIAGNNGGVYATPGTVQSLAALPGSDTAVVVGTNGSGIASNANTIAIYDSGVVRGTTITNFIPGSVRVNSSTSEVYAANYNSYAVYKYSAGGLTQPSTTVSNGTYSLYGTDDLQIAGGRAYTDLGTVYDAEAGALLGTFYATGSTAAQGPTVADTTLGRVFILNNPQGYAYSYGYSQIQSFNISDFNPSTASVIPVGVDSAYAGTASRMTRWGANGLAFRTSVGVYSLRSNLVKDLSGTSADVAVSLTSSGASATGGNTTYTANVVNNGPSAATSVALTAQLPATGVVKSATSSAGSCTISTAGVACNLGSLAKLATAKVTIVVQQTAAGSMDASVQVSASEVDPTMSNNQSSTTVAVTGAAYNLQPVVDSITPSGIRSGDGDTVITVTGTGFNANSAVQLNGTALGTSYENATTLTATVPSANLAAMGWSGISVVNPTPGGGTSNTVPLTVYNVLTIGVNHILYDPYSRNIMASVGSGSSTVIGNSIAPITPETGAIGTAVDIGSQPTNLALTSDGNILYTMLTGSQSIARFNMLSRKADFTWQVPDMEANQLRGITALPGSENTIALDLGSWAGNAIFDFDPAKKTAVMRGKATGPYTGSCIFMPTATDMLAVDTDTSGATFDHYTVTAAGFEYYNYQQYVSSTLTRGGCFKSDGKKVFTTSGGVADWTTSPATQLGIFGTGSYSQWGYNGDVLPDSSLGRTFYVIQTNSNLYPSVYDTLQAFDNNTYMPAGKVSIDFASAEGTNSSYTPTDVIRWGQDGVAILTSGGHIYLLRGPAVVPELLNQNTPATLTSSSASTIAVGSGNTMLTLTGSHFVPGVAVTWNGSYRTTTIVDATHLSVAIPASDLAVAATGSIVATNPGAGASSSLTITVK